MSDSQSVLVTGGAGFIGRSVVAHLLKQGARVTVLDALTYAGHKENLEGLGNGKNLRFVHGTICDAELVTQLLNEEQVDAVIHLAAESHVDNSIASSAVFIDTNIVGTYTMLEASRHYWLTLDAARQGAFRFVYVSTDEVFGSLDDRGVFTEESPIQPNSPYSASKAAGDLLARAWYETYGFPVITTHCSNNYGPFQYPEKLIPHMILQAMQGKSLPIYGDGKNIRDWIHVDDHAAGIFLALSKGVPGQTYGFGGNCERENNHVVTAICELMDKHKPLSSGQPCTSLIAYVRDRLGHDRRYALSSQKAEKELGFKRQYQSLEEGLEQTVLWYIEHLNWCQAVTETKEQKA